MFSLRQKDSNILLLLAWAFARLVLSILFRLPRILLALLLLIIVIIICLMFLLLPIVITFDLGVLCLVKVFLLVPAIDAGSCYLTFFIF